MILQKKKNKTVTDYKETLKEISRKIPESEERDIAGFLESLFQDIGIIKERVMISFLKVKKIDESMANFLILVDTNVFENQ